MRKLKSIISLFLVLLLSMLPVVANAAELNEKELLTIERSLQADINKRVIVEGQQGTVVSKKIVDTDSDGYVVITLVEFDKTGGMAKVGTYEGNAAAIYEYYMRGGGTLLWSVTLHCKFSYNNKDKVTCTSKSYSYEKQKPSGVSYSEKTDSKNAKTVTMSYKQGSVSKTLSIKCTVNGDFSASGGDLV